MKSLHVEEDSDNSSVIRDVEKEQNYSDACRDCCAFASWDKTVALYGCRSAAKAVLAAQTLASKSDRRLREKLFDSSENPLLSFFNLQTYAQGDWDHPDFSESECLLGLQFFVYIFFHEPVLILACSLWKRRH